MPIAPTYPGVYVEEISSGVRTITGVSTSVTAFVGAAKRGPINKAVRVLGYADFERTFGGLLNSSEMSYAVRQFFNNGGTEAWIVRVTKSALQAGITLNHGGSGGTPVLLITAVDSGASGNAVRLIVDYATSNPASTFNLTVASGPRNDPSTITESFANLSMDSKSSRYVETVIKAQSKLITAKNIAIVTGTGTSESGTLADSDAVALDAAHSQFRISADWADPVTVTVSPAATLTALATALTTAVHAAGATGVNVTVSTNTLLFTSTASAHSSVRILPGLTNDAAARLKLGTANGGVETDASAAFRPDVQPAAGSVTGAAVNDTDVDTKLPGAGKTTLRISVDGGVPRTVTLGTTSAANSDALAALLQTAIRAADTSSNGYRNFTVTTTAPVAGKHQFIFTSGTTGSGSSVAVTAGASDDIANSIGMLTGATATAGADVTLGGGSEVDFDATAPFSAIIASRAARTGLYALDAVDIFNILCVPGVTDGPTLAEVGAYCEERRAFFIVDPPQGTSVDDMETLITGATLPKSKNGSISYPWIQIGDPLANGALRSVAPSGTLAGVFARTDATRGVWKAPAGTEATLVGVQAVDYALSDRENGVLNPHGVNCNRIFPVYGAVSWGARTLQGDDAQASEWKYIPVRRLALFLEESLYRGTQWVV
ncbi:MAG TPA: phage tail sheath subtilisin-like domain-containing protein, partial [Thermoanaerobaculia bacterium]|nr:phage tail sheath subtilisin-like domain-containing protein [Thermoanaerobaculia bacterium]